MGKKIVIKKSDINNDVVWLKKADENQIKSYDEDIYLDVISANENELDAYFTHIYYSSGNRDSKETARFFLRRK